jgi:hypothetical protein
MILKFWLNEDLPVELKASIHVTEHVLIELKITIFLGIKKPLWNWTLRQLNKNDFFVLLYSQSLFDNIIFRSVSRRYE